MTMYLIHYIDLPSSDNNQQGESGFFNYKREGRQHTFEAVPNPDDASNFTYEEALDTQKWLYRVMPDANVTIMQTVYIHKGPRFVDEPHMDPPVGISSDDDISNIPPPGAASGNPRDLVVHHRSDIGMGNVPNTETLPDEILEKLRNLWQNPVNHAQVSFIVGEMAKDMLKITD